MKILVIDDEEMIRALARKIIERSGYEVLLAESGQDGIKLFSEHQNDIGLVILDLKMEGISGVETLRLIRQIVPNMPCIISSGQITDKDDLPEELATSVVFLQKPYRAGALAQLVDEHVINQPATTSE
ncbi:MAG TPA: response regulator [candidate division Zixibacteria bacterium]|nr:response regulator [candidate division Zixibacteria bacterium]